MSDSDEKSFKLPVGPTKGVAGKITKMLVNKRRLREMFGVSLDFPNLDDFHEEEPVEKPDATTPFEVMVDEPSRGIEYLELALKQLLDDGEREVFVKPSEEREGHITVHIIEKEFRGEVMKRAVCGVAVVAASCARYDIVGICPGWPKITLVLRTRA